MSGAPNVGEVNQYFNLSLRREKLRKVYDEAKREHGRAGATMAQTDADTRDLDDKIQKLMVNMDLDGPGNHGHTERMAEFHRLLAQCAFEAGQKKERDARRFEPEAPTVRGTDHD